MDPAIDAEGGKAFTMLAFEALSFCDAFFSEPPGAPFMLGRVGAAPAPGTLLAVMLARLDTSSPLVTVVALETTDAAVALSLVGPTGPVQRCTPLVVSKFRSLPSTYATDLFSSFAIALVPPICPFRNHFDSAAFSLSRLFVISFTCERDPQRLSEGRPPLVVSETRTEKELTFSENSGAALGGPCHGSRNFALGVSTPCLFFGRSSGLRSMEAIICSISARLGGKVWDWEGQGGHVGNGQNGHRRGCRKVTRNGGHAGNGKDAPCWFFAPPSGTLFSVSGCFTVAMFPSSRAPSPVQRLICCEWGTNSLSAFWKCHKNQVSVAKLYGKLNHRMGV